MSGCSVEGGITILNRSVLEKKSIFVITLISILSMAELLLSLNTITITDTLSLSDFNLLTILFFIIAILAFYEATLCFNSSKKDFIRNLLNMAAYMSCFILLLTEVSLETIGVVGILYYSTLILDRICSIIRKHRVITIIRDVVLILFCILFGMGCSVAEEDTYLKALAFIPLILIVQSMIRVVTISFSQLDLKLLIKIIKKTYAPQILAGLLILIISFSFILIKTEKTMMNIGDALWYCFAIITTIGFGDFTTVSTFGRILSVILGAYGIIVISLITSIIVNFYEEKKNNSGNPEDVPGGCDGLEDSWRFVKPRTASGFLALRNHPTSDASNIISEIQNEEIFRVFSGKWSGCYVWACANGLEGWVNANDIVWC